MDWDEKLTKYSIPIDGLQYTWIEVNTNATNNKL